MERSTSVGKAVGSSGRRLLAGLMVSLLVVGGAISVGSAMGKGGVGAEDNHGSGGEDFGESHSGHHDGDDQAAGNNSTGGTPPANTTHFSYTFDTVGATDDQNVSFEISDWSFGVENPTT